MSNDIKLLHPDLQTIIKNMQAQDKTIGIAQTFRTQAEQDALYAQGRTRAGNIVTWVKYPNSNHNWGIGFDFFRNDKSVPNIYYDNDGWFTKIGKLGKSYGLEWGGDWKDTVDKPHLQFPITTNFLISKYKTPTEFKKTWKSGQYYEIGLRSNLSNNTKSNAQEVIKVETTKPAPKPVKSVDEAIRILEFNDIITTPEFWRNANLCVLNLGKLLINMANKLNQLS